MNKPLILNPSQDNLIPDPSPNWRGEKDGFTTCPRRLSKGQVSSSIQNRSFCAARVLNLWRRTTHRFQIPFYPSTDGITSNPQTRFFTRYPSRVTRHFSFPNPKSLTPTPVFFAIALVLLIAFALRIHLLGAQSFWNDEGSSYVQATRSFADIAFHAGRDIHPPGYYWMLAIWRAFVGESEWALRAFSAFASTLTVAVVYTIGRGAYRGRAGIAVGLLAAGFTALNTFSLYYAQEARMYAMFALWGALTLWILRRLIRAPRSNMIIRLALVTAAGLWTQYAYPFFMVAGGVAVVIALITKARARDWHGAARLFILYAGANLAALALYLPWIPTALAQITTWPNTGEPIPLSNALSTILHWLIYGITGEGVALAIPLIVVLFALMSQQDRHDQVRLLLPLLWTAIPLVLFLMLGLFRPANLKFLLPAQIGMALLLARGVWRLWVGDIFNRGDGRNRWLLRLTAMVSALWLGLNMASLIAPLYDDARYQRADYRAIATTITDEARTGDAIILDAPNQSEVFGYYYRGAIPVYGLPRGLGGDDAETRRAITQIIAEYQRAFVVFWGEGERDPGRVVETTLDQAAFEAGDTWVGDIRLARYIMPSSMMDARETNARFGESIRLNQYALNAETLASGDALQLALEWMIDSPLEKRYKVFVQLLDRDGVLALQRDSEPGGGLSPTTAWLPNVPISDQHALIVPRDFAPGAYTLIVGLYVMDDPTQRLMLDDGMDALMLGEIIIQIH